MNRWLGISQLAKTRKGRKSGAGYTIVEVLIVLAVTTLMFVAVAIVFSGRQRTAQFTQSRRDFESRLQATIVEVISGNFDSGQTCNSITAAPGTNKSCIFLGKVFAVGRTSSEILTVVGNRTANIGGQQRDVTTIAQAAPRALYNTPGEYSYTHTFGMVVPRMFTMDASGANVDSIGTIAFLSQLGGGISGGDNPLSGSRSLVLYSVTGSTVSDLPAVAASKVTAANLSPAPNGVRICLRDDDGGSTNRKAEIIIGAANSQTSINIIVGDDDADALNSECRRND